MDNAFEAFINAVSHPLYINGVTINLSLIGVLLITLNKTTQKIRNHLFLLGSIAENIYSFVLKIFEDLGPKLYKNLFPIFLSLFTILLVANILGLFPFAFSLTGHLAVTVILAFMTFTGWVILGLKSSKFAFIFLFLPDNCPRAILPLMSVIELLSFFIRPLSLSIRLFANILSGHILLYILASTVFEMYSIEIFILITIVLTLVTAFFGLEIGIGGLQSYIFTLLSIIYLSEAVVKHPAPRFLPSISRKLIGVRFCSTSSRNSAGYHWLWEKLKFPYVKTFFINPKHNIRFMKKVADMPLNCLSTYHFCMISESFKRDLYFFITQNEKFLGIPSEEFSKIFHNRNDVFGLLEIFPSNPELRKLCYIFCLFNQPTGFQLAQAGKAGANTHETNMNKNIYCSFFYLYRDELLEFVEQFKGLTLAELPKAIKARNDLFLKTIFKKTKLTYKKSYNKISNNKNSNKTNLISLDMLLDSHKNAVAVKEPNPVANPTTGTPTSSTPTTGNSTPTTGTSAPL
jgi:F-type H+-transporting ATPase subunit a